MENVPSIDYLAIIVATVYSFLIGWLWYSSALFGKKWQEFTKVTSDSVSKSDMWKSMIGGIVASFFIAYTLAHFLQYFKTGGFMSGFHAGAGLWFGVVLMYAMMTMFYEKRPFGLFAINMGYQFLSITGMGVIIAYMQF